MRIDQEKPSKNPRAGGIVRRLLVVLSILGTGGALFGGSTYFFKGDNTALVITRKPTVGEFVTDIVERGDIESSSNTELRCEVSASDGVRILELVPEGTFVNPGDVVVQLDDSNIKKDLNTQKIALNTAQAALSKAENELSAEIIARKEYEEGTFVQEKQKLESERFVAEEYSRRAKNYYEHSKKLAARGYITETQLESDRFSVEKWGKDLDAASTKLRVICDYTLPKMLKKHDSTIKTAEAAVIAEKAKCEIEQKKLDLLESQLTKCIIKAPSAGQVVYNNQDRWRGDEYFVRKGNKVRERQIIVKLPDIGKMQVKAKISEARVDRVKPGMEAKIRVEALRGAELTGKVQTVSAYASDENWFNPNSKEYDAIIIVDEPPATLKPGMTSQVSIRVETQADVLQAPVQAVVQREGKHYVVVKEASGKLVLREITIGSTNDKFIIVKAGIDANDELVMNPRPHLTKLGLKDIEGGDEKSKSKDEKKSEDSSSSTAAPQAASAGSTRGAP